MPRYGQFLTIDWGNSLNQLMTAFEQVGEDVITHAREAGEQTAKEWEAYAKANANWQDITGDARGGLRGDFEFTVENMIVALSYSVPYGIFLELKHAGQNAIIGPTTNMFMAMWMSKLRM